MNTPSVFQFQDTYALRIVTVDAAPWFVAADLAKILEYSVATKIARMCDDDERGVHNLDTPHGEQKFIIISQPGLFRALANSRSVRAKPFQRWLFHDVLPKIMATGSYAIPETQPARPTSLGEIGQWIASQYANHATRYLYRSGQSVSPAVRAGIVARFGLPARDIPVDRLPELLDTLDEFGDDCYRLWQVSLQLEGWMLDQWRKRGDAMPPEIKALMQQVEVPKGPETTLASIRANIKTMLPGGLK